MATSAELQRAGPGRPPTGARERILEAALEILKSDGYTGLTTARVAELAGQNKALISYHFGGKQGLVAEVARGVAELITGRTREAIAGEFLDGMTRENFAIAHDVSAYSLSALAKAARPLMKGRNGSIVTLSYLGAERALVNYNLMGVAKASLEASVRYLALNLGPEGTRVNAISAGPIKTLAAAGIAGFRKILGHVEENAPLRRTVTIEDVGNVAAFLCSDLAAGVTGEVTYVDAGYNILGMTGIGNE